MEQIAKLVRDVAAEFDSEDVSFYNGYSGRGMYGAKCIGLTGSFSDCMRALAEVFKAAHANVEVEFDDVVDTLMDMKQDSMGRDVIIYWPQVEALEEPQEGHDGQPDEAQEWHDFDPDC